MKYRIFSIAAFLIMLICLMPAAVEGSTATALSGSVTIDGTVAYGKTVTANYSGTETISSYQWYIDDLPIPYATTNTYTPVKNDVGKKLSVHVSDGEMKTAISTAETVEKATLTIADAAILEKAYDGTKTATVESVTFIGIVAGDNLERDIEYTVTAVYDQSSAGVQQTVTVTVELRNTDYYRFVDSIGGEATVNTYSVNDQTIKKVELTKVNVTQSEVLTYLGSAANLKVTETAESVADHEVTFTYSMIKDNANYTNIGSIADFPTAAGEYTVYYKTTAPNHNDYIGEFKVKIDKALLTVTNAKLAEKIYDGTTTAQVTDVTFDGLVNGELLTLGIDYTVNAEFIDVDVGTNKNILVSVALLDTALANNYTIDGSFELGGYEIEKADYPGEPITYCVEIVNGGVRTGSINIADMCTLFGAKFVPDSIEPYDLKGGIMNIDGFDVTADSISYESRNNYAGTAATDEYKVQISTTNYENITAIITFQAIEKTPVYFKFTIVDNYTYDGTEKTGYTGEITNTSGYTGEYDVYHADMMGNRMDAAPTDAGVYQLVVSIPFSDDRYSGSTSHVFTIKQKVVTPYISGGTVKLYDGTALASSALELKLNGIVEGDAVMIEAAGNLYNSSSVLNADTITAIGITLSGEDAANYSLSKTTATAAGSIEPAELTVSGAVLASKVYDGKTDAQVEQISFVGLVGNETLILGVDYTVTAAFTSPNAGEQSAAVTVVLANANYRLAADVYTAVGNIEKAEPTVEFPSNLNADEGKTLASVQLPSGFAWCDQDTVIVLGDNPAEIVYTSADPNYHSVTKTVTVFGAHWYSDSCDASCNACGALRNVTHRYSNDCDEKCNSCGYIRSVSDHVYDNACDADCNVCGETRAVRHSYSNTCDEACNLCGETRTIRHSYRNACDEECNVCGYIRKVNAHVYDNACDTNCNLCGEKRSAVHAYDNACDVDCNVCGAVRTIEHSYGNACDKDCDVCGAVRTPNEHVYDNACDVNCNVCGEARTTEHSYGNACDKDCDVCGAVRTPSEHVYDNACDTDCNVCGEPRAAAHHYDDAYDMNCNVCGAVRALGSLEESVKSFMERYLTDENGDVSVDDYTVEQLLSAKEAWNTLSEEEREEVNRILREKGGKTFEKLLEEAEASSEAPKKKNVWILLSCVSMGVILVGAGVAIVLFRKKKA